MAASLPPPISSFPIRRRPRPALLVACSVAGDGPSSPTPDSDADSGDSAVDPVKLAFARAKAYRIAKQPQAPSSEAPAEVNAAPSSSGQEKKNVKSSDMSLLDKQENKALKVSRTDFLGLDFSEKKRYRGVPPGLAPTTDPTMGEDITEVELIVGDTSQFVESTSWTPALPEVDDNSILYKPKVSTWGVFPRPSNISKTYGGGRNIQPGELLETAENKAAKEKRTKELLAAYKSKIGLTVDATTKIECEKALKEGDHLMNLGRLKDALPFYEQVMKSVTFQSELHGLAALQWSICQDSLRRSDDARVMYEKLRSHPNIQVSKKAKQFMFSFQAMEMMKTSGSILGEQTGYETYFDAFVDQKSVYNSPEDEKSENAANEIIVYLIFLSSPILLVFLSALNKLLH